jgi:leucyl-tRNA synthetase
MFPYPSGEGLHVGHVRIFTACDVMARYFKMKGDKVMSPMGWDAFGLPAENAAIKAHKIPQEMVPHNYANFKKQMQNLSLDFDWEREFATTDPSYYAITQWIFLQLYNSFEPEHSRSVGALHSGSVGERKRLVYREKVAINWCPKCLTGLANEEVLPDGTHERCGTLVGKKLLPQWVMRITSYAERLLNDLDMDLSEYFGQSGNSEVQRIRGLENRKGLDWPTGILEMQRNWIGKKEGARIKFVLNKEQGISNIDLEVFTTRVDTINGVTFVVVAPEIAKTWMDSGWDPNREVKEYVEMALSKSEQSRLEGEKEKTGVDTGIKVINPWNQEEVPVWVADYALVSVGTGAVMGVPQYDERDLAFAKKFGLPIKKLELDDYEQVLSKLEKMGVAKRETTYHLRDWVFSRQRYWGEPIPLVYCDKCGDENGVVPLPESALPLTLPKLESYEPTDTGESPLSRVDDWVNTTCPHCGGPARRETDTMPNWAGSCWYFLAFAFWNKDFKIPTRSDLVGRKSKNLQDQTFESQPYTDWWFKEALPKIKEWLPVDWYLGGAEHAVLHLLYARFWVKVLQDLGLLDFPEPFLRLRSVGLVLAEDGKKMSKSVGNVVNPDDMVAKYGSDAVRMYEMFMGPWEQSIAWDSGAISGQVRFLGRIKETVKMVGKVGEKTTPELAAKLKELVGRVEEGVLNQKFNTSIAGLMEWVNAWRVDGVTVSKDHLEIFATLLSLFAPMTANELGMGESSIWPDVSMINGVEEVRITIAVQINGKLRSTYQVSSTMADNKDWIVKLILADEHIKKWVTGEVRRIVFVPRKLVNLVV